MGWDYRYCIVLSVHYTNKKPWFYNLPVGSLYSLYFFIRNKSATNTKQYKTEKTQTQKVITNHSIQWAGCSQWLTGSDHADLQFTSVNGTIVGIGQGHREFPFWKCKIPPRQRKNSRKFRSVKRFFARPNTISTQTSNIYWKGNSRWPWNRFATHK